MSPRFPLGRLLQTPGVQASIPGDALAAALARHITGDFGDLCPEDVATNELAIEDGAQILSCYQHDGNKFYIITDPDRSRTTALLPSEY